MHSVIDGKNATVLAYGQVSRRRQQGSRFESVYDFHQPPPHCVHNHLPTAAQTGSGKTFTMGTGFDVSKSSSLDADAWMADGERELMIVVCLTPSSRSAAGILPRAIQHLFTTMEETQQEAVDTVRDAHCGGGTLATV
jgi:hypothetical protein